MKGLQKLSRCSVMGMGNKHGKENTWIFLNCGPRGPSFLNSFTKQGRRQLMPRAGPCLQCLFQVPINHPPCSFCHNSEALDTEQVQCSSQARLTFPSFKWHSFPLQKHKMSIVPALVYHNVCVAKRMNNSSWQANAFTVLQAFQENPEQYMTISPNFEYKATWPTLMKTE